MGRCSRVRPKASEGFRVRCHLRCEETSRRLPVAMESAPAVLSPELASAAASLVPGAAAAAPKKKGRPSKGSRPKIDIDDEIAQANRMAEITKKMMLAARAAQRNSRRAKQRLVRRAGKLSPADLERLAVLKRCGLYIEAPEASSGDSTSVASSAASSSSSCAASPAFAPTTNMKLLAAMGKVDGAAELLSSFGGSAPSDAGVTDVPASAARGAAAQSNIAIPRGKRLGPPHLAASSLASLPAPASADGRDGAHRADGAEETDMDDEEHHP